MTKVKIIDNHPKKNEISMNNLNIHNKKNSLSQLLSQYFYNIDPVPDKIITDNLENHLQSYPASTLKVLSYLYATSKKYEDNIIFPSHKNAARVLGIHYNTVTQAVKMLVRDGFVAKRPRWNSSNVYKLSSIFNNPFYLSRMSHLLASIRIFCLSFLLSNTALGQHHELVNKQGLLGTKINYISHGQETGERGKQGGDIMQKLSERVYGANPISPLIQQLNTKHGFNLTEFAMLKLASFPDQAIQFGMDNIRYTKHIRDPYKWMFKMALDFCSDNGLKPDWNYSATFIVARGYEQNSPIYEELKTKKEIVATPSVSDKVLFVQRDKVLSSPKLTATSKSVVKEREWKPETVARVSSPRSTSPLTEAEQHWASMFKGMLNIDEKGNDLLKNKPG